MPKQMSILLDAITKTWPEALETHTGPAFVRPAWTNDATIYDSGFYWTNICGDRFYFDTLEEAAEDFAVEIGLSEPEARELIAA